MHPVVFNDNGHAGVGTYRGDWRLPGSQDTANDGVANDGVFRHPFDFQTWRNDLHIEFTVYRRALTAGVGCADAQRMLPRAQFEGIQIEFVGRLIINLEELAIDEKLHLRNLCLATCIYPNHFHITDFGPGRWFEIVGYGRRQGRDLKCSSESSNIAFDIADRDIQPVFAGRLPGGFNRVSLICRYDFAVKRDFDAFDFLVGQDLDLDLCIFSQRFRENIVGQE